MSKVCRKKNGPNHDEPIQLPEFIEQVDEAVQTNLPVTRAAQTCTSGVQAACAAKHAAAAAVEAAVAAVAAATKNAQAKPAAKPKSPETEWQAI